MMERVEAPIFIDEFAGELEPLPLFTQYIMYKMYNRSYHFIIIASVINYKNDKIYLVCINESKIKY